MSGSNLSTALSIVLKNIMNILLHIHVRKYNTGSVELSMMVRGEVSQVRVGVIAAKRRNSVVLNTVRVELPNREILRL